jgi:hypothetical protein
MPTVNVGSPAPFYPSSAPTSVQSNVTVTAGSNVTVLGYGNCQAVLVINVTGTVSGTNPTLTYTLQEVDPGNGTTLLGNTIVGPVINAAGTYTVALSIQNSGYVNIAWAVTGTTPSFGGVYATLTSVGSILQDPEINGSYPDPLNGFDIGTTQPSIDQFGNLMIRGPVFVDEGSFRYDFSGTALTTALTGTVNWTNGSTLVTGIGTTFTTQIASGQYVKKTADGEADYVQVQAIISNTQLLLASGYAGTTATGVASVVTWWATTTGTGGSETVANSIVTIASGTTANSTTLIKQAGDFLPYTLQFYAEISQRIANQTIFFGFQDTPGSPQQQAIVQFTGTSVTGGNLVTSFSSAATDIQTTPFTFSAGATTASYNFYKLDLSGNQATLSINGTVVATNTIHLPAPYTVLNVVAGITNGGTAPASSTNLLIDYVYFENVDRVQIDDDFPGEPLPVTLQQTSSNAGLRWGTIALTVNTASKIESTTYTEQTTAVQRSWTSSSATDAAAGTGARTVAFTYYDASGNGPYTEVDTLNGATAVNTVATNICFVEGMVVQTVGSGGVNAGTLTLFTTTGGGGTAIGTIAIGVNTTEWAHHYTPNGYISNITGFSCEENGSQGSTFYIKAQALASGVGADVQISNNLRPNSTSNGAGTVQRTYGSPLQVSGPARIRAWVLPDQSITATYGASFDFYDEAG